MLNINTYDEYGKPGASNAGRFQYTGQMWIGDVSAYYYKARFYSPLAGGRFLQTDPIWYWDSANPYAYVSNDPVNLIDPLGLCGYSYYFDEYGYPRLDKVECEGDASSGGTSGYYPGAGTSNEPNVGPGVGGGGSKPQKMQTKSRTQCALDALGENWKGLGLDVLGFAATAAFPGGSAAIAIAGSVIGVTGFGLAFAGNHGPADAALSGSLALTGKYAAGAEGILRGAGSALGHRIGLGALTASTLYDAGKTALSYNKCRSGN